MFRKIFNGIKTRDMSGKPTNPWTNRTKKNSGGGREGGRMAVPRWADIWGRGNWVVPPMEDSP